MSEGAKIETVYRANCHTGFGCVTAEACYGGLSNRGRPTTVQIKLVPFEMSEDPDNDITASYLDDDLSESYVDRLASVRFQLTTAGLRSLIELLIHAEASLATVFETDEGQEVKP